MLTKRGVKLLDFGLAKLRQDPQGGFHRRGTGTDLVEGRSPTLLSQRRQNDGRRRSDQTVIQCGRSSCVVLGSLPAQPQLHLRV
jgi:hypothetical protein